MKFESGMLGFLIIVLAIGGAIGGTILLSADEQTYEVTKYDYKTDITGLFPVDNTPEFYDYDLARNYTGYYTPSSQINGVNYFNGASFTKTGVNNYPVRYTPTSSTTLNVTIDSTLDETLTSIYPNQSSSVTTTTDYYESEYGNRYLYSSMTYSRTIRSLIEQLNVNDYDVIEIKGLTGWEHSDHQSWAYFGYKGQFHENGLRLDVNYVNKDYFNTYPQDETYHIASNSIKIDVRTNTVFFYYEGTISGNSLITTKSLNDCVITYGVAALAENGDGIPLTIKAYDVGNVEYMDISKGVMVIGGS